MTEETKQLNQELIEKEITHPEILDITKPEDIQKAVNMAASGSPIAFCGEGIYGLGGIATAFVGIHGEVPNISEMKERNFYDNPPIGAPSWPMLEKLVDWQNLGSSKQLIKDLYDTLPIHLVLPVKENEGLEFAKRREGVLCHAFMCTGDSQTLQDLISEFENQTDEVFLMTSANLRGEPSYTKPEQVTKTFPQIPLVLADKRIEFTDIAMENTSFSIYDFTDLPYEIKLLRLGSVAHSSVVQAVIESSVRPAEFRFDQLDKILTDEPLIT